MKQVRSATRVEPMRRRTAELQPKPELPEVQSYEPQKRRPAAELMKNLAVSAALLVCVVALRAGAIPPLQGPVDAVLTAMTGDPLLDDRLGKLSFVASMFPETVLVFGEAHDGLLAMPVSGGSLSHAWTREEPYAAWSSADGEVFAAISGEVTGVYHGMDEELLVEVSTPGGLVCVHGNLAEAAVHTGDRVVQGQPIGRLLKDQQLAFEVKQHGLSIDPVTLLPGVS